MAVLLQPLGKSLRDYVAIRRWCLAGEAALKRRAEQRVRDARIDAGVDRTGAGLRLHCLSGLLQMRCWGASWAKLSCKAIGRGIGGVIERSEFN